MGRFLLKPSLIPTISILGLDIAAMLSIAFIVELIFNWPGLSRYGMNAILRKDVNAISAVILVLGVVFIFVNTEPAGSLQGSGLHCSFYIVYAMKRKVYSVDR